MKFVKPSGQEVEVNENSESYARSIGWVPVGEKPAEVTQEEPKQEEAKAKRGRPKKGFF